MIDIEDEKFKASKPIIKVIGVGGAGNNAINRMIEDGLKGIEFIACNTDDQDLEGSKADKKVQLGATLTKGLGAGGDPQIGEGAAIEAKEELEGLLKNTNMLFVTAGMGGGTGTGAAPIISQIAKDSGILTVGIVTKPFAFEGAARIKKAEEGIKKLKESVDTLIIIPNEKLLEVMDEDATFLESFAKADEVLRQGVQGVSDLITKPGSINLDFADVTSVMKNKGLAHMGVGVATGKNKILEATKIAISSPMIETSIVGGSRVLVNVSGDPKMGLRAVNETMGTLRNVLGGEPEIFIGITINEELEDTAIVTIITTGLDDEVKAQKNQGVQNPMGMQIEMMKKVKTENEVHSEMGQAEATKPLTSSQMIQITKGEIPTEPLTQNQIIELSQADMLTEEQMVKLLKQSKQVGKVTGNTIPDIGMAIDKEELVPQRKKSDKFNIPKFDSRR